MAVTRMNGQPRFYECDGNQPRAKLIPAHIFIEMDTLFNLPGIKLMMPMNTFIIWTVEKPRENDFKER